MVYKRNASPGCCTSKSGARTPAESRTRTASRYCADEFKQASPIDAHNKTDTTPDRKRSSLDTPDVFWVYVVPFPDGLCASHGARCRAYSGMTTNETYAS